MSSIKTGTASMKSQKLGFLTELLCMWPTQASLIGTSVLPVLLLVRLVILGAAAQTAWVDDDKFLCYTEIPGYNVACYNKLTPLAAPRLWTLQLVLVLAPGLVFLCYLIHLANQQNQVNRGDTGVKGHVLGVYQTCVASVMLVEVVFMVTQSLLLGFWVRDEYKCAGVQKFHVVDCFIPRARQKTCFLFIMFIASCTSLLLSVVELIFVRLRNRQPDGADALQSGSEVAESPCFLRQMLSLWHSHASLLGKTVLPVLQLSRVVIVGAAVQSVWEKGFKEFACNTKQPGCTHATFNLLFPFSLHQFWTLQAVLVLAPGLIFFCYLVHFIIQEKKSGPGAKVKGHVLRAYVGILSTGVLMEVVFALVQAVMFGFSLSTIYNVNITPCPGQVECYLPQATEKTVFISIMFAVTCLSGLLILMEMCVVLNRERLWEKQQNKISETSDCQMESTVKAGEVATESKESCLTLNI